VYPALAVLQAIASVTLDEAGNEIHGHPKDSLVLPPDFSILWIGGSGGMESDLVSRVGLPFEEIPAAGLHGVGLTAMPGNMLKLMRGYQKSKQILQRFKPDVLFFTGGYLAVPLALAGRRIPSVLYVPDIEPGLALRTIANFSQRIALSTEESRRYFPGRKALTVTGYPTRSGLSTWKRDAAQKHLGLSGNLPTLLVFGGSKGAHSINRAVISALPDLLKEMQVVLISGETDWKEIQSTRDSLSRNYDASFLDKFRAFPYLYDDEMGAALSVADLVLSRAGASILGEFPLFGLPAIVVPYPHAWRYQQVNAQYLASHGAAIVVQDADLPDHVLPVIQELIRDHDRRKRMRQAMLSLARPNAAKSIGHILQDLVMDRGRKGL
jgi:UDP-N-acetylglucosamine--N-acetylmuramyl-(pentapeptide) pyrophosphoryl-undecaprenol N-acetylglucosamine transferase